MAAFKEGYSFNTLLKGGDLRDALRVRKSGSAIKVAGSKTTAVVEGTTTKVCVVSRAGSSPLCWYRSHGCLVAAASTGARPARREGHGGQSWQQRLLLQGNV